MKNGVKKLMKKKYGSIGPETLAYLFFAILVLVLGVAIYLVLKGKGIGAIEYVKQMLRFGVDKG